MTDPDRQRRRLLLLAFYVPPATGGGVPRPTKLSAFLEELGWEVTVLTVRRTGDIDPLLAPPPRLITTKEVNLGWLLRAFDRLERALARRASRQRDAASEPPLIETEFAVREAELPASRPGWFLPAVLAGVRSSRRARFDVVLASQPPPVVGMAGCIIARITRTPFVLEYRDPWSVDPVWRYDDIGRPRHDPAVRARLRVARLIEGAMLRQAAGAIVVNGEPNVAALKDTFPRALKDKPVWHIPNGVDLDDVRRTAAVARSQPLTNDPSRASRLVVSHNGHFYGHHTPYFVVRGLRELAASDPATSARLRVDFVGWGFPERLRLALPEWGLEDIVRVLPAESYSGSLVRQHRANALLLVLPPYSSYVDCIPTKLWEYMAMGKPIISVSPHGRATELLSRELPVLHAEPTSPVAIASAFRGLVELIDATPLGEPATRHDAPWDYRSRARDLNVVLRSVTGSR